MTIRCAVHTRTPATLACTDDGTYLCDDHDEADLLSSPTREIYDDEEDLVDA